MKEVLLIAGGYTHRRRALHSHGGVGGNGKKIRSRRIGGALHGWVLDRRGLGKQSLRHCAGILLNAEIRPFGDQLGTFLEHPPLLHIERGVGRI